jgi:hypothetical protein
MINSAFHPIGLRATASIQRWKKTILSSTTARPMPASAPRLAGDRTIARGGTVPGHEFSDRYSGLWLAWLDKW